MTASGCDGLSWSQPCFNLHKQTNTSFPLNFIAEASPREPQAEQIGSHPIFVVFVVAGRRVGLHLEQLIPII